MGKFETTPKSETLEEKIGRTAAARDKVTESLLSKLIPDSKTPRKFITDACKFAGIRPPKPHDNLAPFVYKLQKEVCKFPEEETKNGCDGKCGPITFEKLIEEIPQLKVFSKAERSQKFKDSRRDLISAIGGSPSQTIPEGLPKLKDHQSAIMIGDSLTREVAKRFYKGSKKFGRYNREYFKKSRSVVTSRKMLEKQLPALANKPAYTVWLGTNDVAFRSADKIFSELEKIYKMLINNNPKCRIVAISLLPNKKYQHKIDIINRRIKAFVQAHPQNMTYFNLHDKVSESDFYADGIHLKERTSTAVAGLLKMHLTQNTTLG